MSTEYCVNSVLNKIINTTNITHISQTYLYYPKCTVISKTGKIWLINITENDLDEKVFQFDDEIIDSALVDNVLYVVSKSGKVFLVDVLKERKYEIQLLNYESYIIHTVKLLQNQLYLISESEECFLLPYSIEHSLNKIDEDTKVLEIMPQKKHVNLGVLMLAESNHNEILGLNFCMKNGFIIMECPLTGIKKQIHIPEKINVKDIKVWEDTLVVTNDHKIWLLDLKTTTVPFECTITSDMHYLLGSHSNKFYYMSYNNIEGKISHLQYQSALSEDNFQDSEGNSTLKTSQSQEILKSQLKNCVNLLITTDINIDEVYLQSKSLAQQIDNISFLIEMAVKLCQHNIKYKSFLYLTQSKIIETTDKKQIQALYDLIFKLDIKEYIVFKGNNKYADCNLFDFDCIQLCILFISKSDFDLASLCWLKYSVIREVLTIDNIIEILSSIPHNAKMGELIIWLKNFVPSVLEENPYHIDLLVRWTTERVFSFEHSTYWPKIGLKFINEILTVIISSLKKIIIRPISMDDLDILRDRIVYIMELKDKYKINILLAELSALKPSEVALIMLHRCYTEDLSMFINDYLPTYASRFNFDLDEILRTYIDNEAATGGGSIDCSRFEILLSAFQLPTNKLECILSVLRYLDVPWNKRIYEIATTTVSSTVNDFTSNEFDHNLVHEISEEINYANLKVVLKKHNYPLTHTDYVTVIHKIVNAPVVDIKDLSIVLNIATNHKQYGSLLYIDRALHDCNTKEALEYISTMPLKEKRLLLKSAMFKYENMILNHNDKKNIERCYIDFFKGAMLEDIEIATFEGMYHLKNSFKTKMCLNAMYGKEPLVNCENVLNENTNEKMRYVSRLTHSFHWKNTAIIEILQKTSISTKVRIFVKKLLGVFYLEIDKQLSKITEICSLFMQEQNNSCLILECCQILVHLATNCSEEYLYFITKVLTIINSLLNMIVVMKNLTSAWNFNYMYIPLYSFTSEKSLLQMYSKSFDMTLCDYDFLSNVCNRSEFIYFRILANIMDSNNYIQLDDVHIQWKQKTIIKMITKAVSQESDDLLMTNLLLMLKPLHNEDNTNWLLSILKGSNETMLATAVSYVSSQIVCQIFDFNDILPRNKATYPPQHILKSKYKMNLADIALPDITEETWDVKLVLFYILKQQPMMSICSLTDLCNTLNVSIDDGLSLQIVAVFTTWELSYKIIDNGFGLQNIVVFENEKKSDYCRILWDSIKNKEFICDVLNDFWKNGEVSLHGRLISINPYFYEVYLCIHQIIASVTEMKKCREFFLLNFLRSYRRRSKPQQYEFELFSVKGMFPEIGYYRLPFHLFMRDDMWLNLKSEITLESYELWLPAVALLSLDKDLQTAKDMICSNALKQTMKTKKTETSPNTHKDIDVWRLCTKEEPLLKAAHRCVKNIANMEWAGACLFYVLQGCGRGADQVAAAQLSYQFAKRWEALQPGNRAVRKMERLHSTLSTRHALHKIDWAIEELVELISEPTQLIKAMYLHDNFVEKMARYDVNGATNEIADKNGINISSIRIQILENILDNSECKNKVFALNNKQLMTAKYILKATCPKMGAIYLSRIAFEDETDFNKHKKFRALQCLMSIVEPDTALKVTNRERCGLWDAIKELFFIIKLECHEMPWAVAAFSQDKKQAVEQILTTAGTNTEALRLLGDLTVTYGNNTLLIKVVYLLMRATLYEEIIPLLLKIWSPPNEIIRNAWKAVLLSPFQSADYPITERQKANCLMTINLLPICPVIRDEYLKEIWKHCVRCKCFGIGCLVLPYMTDETRLSLNEIKRIDRRNLIASLKNLHTDTFLISGAMHVIENMIPKGSYR